MNLRPFPGPLRVAAMLCLGGSPAAGASLPAAAAAQAPAGGMPDSVVAYLDSALSIMERNVIGGDTVDWDAFRARVHERAAGSEIPLDTYRALRWALRTLNPHSFLQTGSERWQEEVERHPELAQPAEQRTERPVLSPFSGRDTPAGALLGPDGARLETDGARLQTDDAAIGYVGVPGFGGGHLTAFADSIQTLIREQDAAGACGWVVDLRGNGGGNMWPMLAGLGPLVGEGRLGEFHSIDGVDGVWFHEAGVTGIDPTNGDERVEIARVTEPYPLDGQPPVAVLFDRGTGSSGEAVAIAFIGRPGARSFGAPSYGFTTANDGFRMPDGANIVLTVGVNADRSGAPHPEALVPDERVEPWPEGEIPAEPPPAEEDPQLQAALEWLRGRAGCGGPTR
jgi:hypothetical protein